MGVLFSFVCTILSESLAQVTRSYVISKSRGRVCGGGGRGDINKRQKASPRKK